MSLTELNVIPLNVTQCVWDCMISTRALRLEFYFATDLFDLLVSRISEINILFKNG